MIVAVEGASLVVAGSDGTTTVFDLAPSTAHFVRRGDPYWGVRLQLGGPADESGLGPESGR